MPPSFRPDTERVMVFLEALRATLVRSGMLVAVCSLAAWPMAEGIVRYLARGISAQLVAFGLPEAFFAFMALSLATGLFAAAPYLLYTVFWPLPDLFPGLNRRQAAVLWLIATLLFYAGALFCLGITLPYGGPPRPPPGAWGPATGPGRWGPGGFRLFGRPAAAPPHGATPFWPSPSRPPS